MTRYRGKQRLLSQIHLTQQVVLINASNGGEKIIKKKEKNVHSEIGLAEKIICQNVTM